jgi:hypothetical protein
MPPVLLEVLAHIPTDFFHCLHFEQLFSAAGIGVSVHSEIQAAYPPGMLGDAARLVTWLQNLSAQYGEQLHIRVVDPQSVEGFFKSLRYWIRQYPTLIINRRTKVVGWESDALERLLADAVPGGGGA